MRINKPRGKQISNRRANRPDQRTYRSLRLNRIYRPKSLLWLELLIGIVLCAALYFIVRRWL